jgi:hypothetical protein
MRQATKLWMCATLAFLDGCSTIPRFQDKITGEKKAAPRVTDITHEIQCEILSAMETSRNYYREDQAVKAKDTKGKALADLYAPKRAWVANVNLTLDVTDDEGVNPSLTYLSHSLSIAPGTNLSIDLSGQFSEEQHRNVNVQFTLLFTDVSDTVGKCDASHNHESELRGNLGIEEIIETGLPFAIGVTKDPYLMQALGVAASAGLTDPLTGAPALAPSFGSTVDFTIIYGLGGSPTWTLKHFNFPAPASGSLLTSLRTHKDTLVLSFAQVAPNQPNHAAAVGGAGKAALDNSTRMILQRLLPP